MDLVQYVGKCSYISNRIHSMLQDINYERLKQDYMGLFSENIFCLLTIKLRQHKKQQIEASSAPAQAEVESGLLVKADQYRFIELQRIELNT